MPFHNWASHDVVDDKKYNLDFRVILMCRYQVLEEKRIPDFEEIGCETFEEYKEIMKWLNTERWLDVSDEVLKEHLTDKEYKEYMEEQHNARNFDMLKDWDAYYVDFKRIYNIDLIEIDYLDWFRFSWLLTGLFTIEDTLSAKRSYARGVNLDEVDKSMKSNIRRQRNLYSLEPVTIKNPFGKETPDGN